MTWWFTTVLDLQSNAQGWKLDQWVYNLNHKSNGQLSRNLTTASALCKLCFTNISEHTTPTAYLFSMCCDVTCAMSCCLYTAVTQTSVLSGVHAVNYQFKEHLNYTLPAAFLPDWSTAEPPARENHLTSGWGSVYWPQNQRGNSGVVSIYLSIHGNSVNHHLLPCELLDFCFPQIFNQTCPYVTSASF